jgi:hypothetical protein
MATSNLFLISHNMGDLGPFFSAKRKKSFVSLAPPLFIVTKMRKLRPPPPTKKTRYFQTFIFFPFSFEENHSLTHLEMNLEI